jgi:hypothetical protein
MNLKNESNRRIGIRVVRRALKKHVKRMNLRAQICHILISAEHMYIRTVLNVRVYVMVMVSYHDLL